MPQTPFYLVVQQVWTAAEIDGRESLGGFYLMPHQSVGLRRSWVAVRAMEAESWRDAYSAASQDMIRLADRLFVVLECVFSLAATNWFVWREHPASRSGVAIINKVEKQDGVGVSLGNVTQRSDLSRLQAANPSALYYFREAGRASTPKTTLAMLVIAAEALAGPTSKPSRCSCGSVLSCSRCGLDASRPAPDEKKLRELLGDLLFNVLYRKPESLRHRMMHGTLIDEGKAQALAREAYESIRTYLAKQFSLQGDRATVNVPRPLETLVGETVCVRPPLGWLPTPIDLQRVNWSSALLAIDEASFGERMEEPEHL